MLTTTPGRFTVISPRAAAARTSAADRSSRGAARLFQVTRLSARSGV